MARAALTRLLRRRGEFITARRAAGTIALGLLASPLAGAQARTPHLWATVNVCDTERWPDTIGIRGSMPGSRDRDVTLWMRFQVQFLADGGRWRNVTDGGDSGFVFVGSARARARQAGRSFRISPRRGEPVLLRGRVSFQWRRDGDVVRSATMRTRRGHRSTAGADPPGYSASTCTVSPDS